MVRLCYSTETIVSQKLEYSMIINVKYSTVITDTWVRCGINGMVTLRARQWVAYSLLKYCLVIINSKCKALSNLYTHMYEYNTQNLMEMDREKITVMPFSAIL